MVRTVARPRSARRSVALGLVIVALFVMLTERLYDLQITNGPYYRELAEQNRVVRLPVIAERGIILDRNGRALVGNEPSFAVSVLPVDLPRARAPELAQRLGALLGRDGQDVLDAISAQRARNPYEPVKVSRKPVSRDIALMLSERAELFPGVRVDAESVRQYVGGALYAPIMGYIGPLTPDELLALRDVGYLTSDDIGRTGIESVYERYLRGTYGWREIERDAAQREIKTLALQSPTVGNTVVLTIDDRLQRLLAAELDKGVNADQFTQAVGIAMSPKTGEILALVSTPAYDNNLFVNGITRAQLASLDADDRQVLVNKAIGEIYPPGSTFKLVTGLAALGEGIATRNTVVNVNAMSINIGSYQFFDWRVHGPLTFVDGFAHSSDIYFYTMAGGNPNTGQRGVGPDAIARYARNLGFGAPTGIDLPGEASGIIPDPAWKEQQFGEPWTIGNTYQEAIGQGFVAVSPLQLLNAYAAVANDGTLYRPHLLKEVRDPSGKVLVTQQPVVIRKLAIPAEDLAIMREGARKVVTSNHAPMPNAKLPIAGKTGTAEYGLSSGKDSAGRNRLGFHNWFVSFLPKADSPDPTAEIAMIVFTFDSSRSLCELCLNPAIGITQRVYEAYFSMGTTP